MANNVLLVNAIDDLLLVDGASLLLLQAVAPTAPTWVTAAGPKDVNASLLLDATFEDPGDSMGAYALKRDIGGTIRYYRESDQTWQVGEIKNTDTSPDVTLASGWGADGDPNHLYYMKTWDIGDLEGVYNTALVITPSAKVEPVLDEPDDGDTVGASSLTAFWTVAQQSAYLLELLDDPGTSVLWTTGWVTDVDLRQRTIAYTLADAVDYKVRLTTKNAEGLASTADTNDVTVSYTPPATPTLTFDTSDERKIVVTIANPTPGVGQPAVASNNLWRRLVSAGDADPTDIGERIATGIANNGSFDDTKTGHLELFEYRAETLGDNNTSVFGAWTS